MKDDVRACYNARADFFDKYYTVPLAAEQDVNLFLSELNALAEQAADSAAFEAEFAASGLSDRFNALLLRCNPKPYQMTDAEKAYSQSIVKEDWEQNKGQILKEEMDSIAESAAMEIEGDLRSARNRAMSEAGILDDYTRATNAIEDLGGLFGGLFKKKK